MSKNKTSVWSTIILVATIISLILLATSIILSTITLPAAWEAARQAALGQSGVTEAEAQLAANVVVTSVIVALGFSVAFDVLKIIGGFKFALQGRWGIFCIVVSIISVVTGIWSLISDISNKAGVGNIVVAVLSLLISILLVVACFKHRAENNE